MAENAANKSMAGGVAGDYGISVASLVLAASRHDKGLVTSLLRPTEDKHALVRVPRAGNVTLYRVQLTEAGRCGETGVTVVIHAEEELVRETAHAPTHPRPMGEHRVQGKIT